LVVNQVPTVTSAATATDTVGQPLSFDITTSGYPTAALTQTGTLPTGVTFVDNGDGTATLAGTPTGTAKTYALKFTAKNAAGSVSQSFALAVNQAPAFTSAATATFTTGKSGTFKVTASGYPTPAMSYFGQLPEGLNLVDNGNGTATLSGTPVAGIGGTYSVAMRANNAVGRPVSQVFTLVINQAPSVTSAATTTVDVGHAMTFDVATTGFPTPALTQTGTLPAGVTFMDNGDGTATLSGTPTGTAKTYALKISAKNAAGTANQSFSLVVQQAPAITSAATATFTTAKAGTFKVTTSGSPAAALSNVGAVPTGVSFVDNGNGTATLTGAASANGVYPLTISATNAAGTISQSFTLVVNQVPAVTSVATTSDKIGQPMSFNVTTSGSPTAALTQTGTLPTGVTFVDNGNGTATLSGTPTGTAKTYALKIKARNAAGAATQSFSLVVTH
jgi:large repetitive protein